MEIRLTNAQINLLRKYHNYIQINNTKENLYEVNFNTKIYYFKFILDNHYKIKEVKIKANTSVGLYYEGVEDRIQEWKAIEHIAMELKQTNQSIKIKPICLMEDHIKYVI